MWIQLENVHKHYGVTKANNGISFTVKAGTIHGILGENGAGKSTLMKILAGYIRKTSGEIKIDGKAVDFRSPAMASRIGIGMLYQDPMDFPQLTVLENFMLGQPGKLSGNYSAAEKRLNALAENLNFSLQPDLPVKKLTVGERHQLEIIRLLSLGIRVLILDEPTTGISEIQKEVLFAALIKLASEGRSVILVSHKMEDVEFLCDNVTVLRQGKVTGEAPRPFQTDHLLQMMFSTRPVPPSRRLIKPGKTVLFMDRVAASGGRSGLQESNVIARQNEVIGLAGLEGSGQGVFLRVAAGLKPVLQGSIFIDEFDMTDKDAVAFQKAGVAFLPTARLEEGLIPGMTICDHFELQNPNRNLLITRQQTSHTAIEKIKKFSIRGTETSPVQTLSGGNQQRLLLSFLPRTPKVLLLENPTRGLDLESAHWVWHHLQKNVERSSTCIIFSSPELDEILMIANRILIFFDGRIVKDVRTDETDIHELGLAIAGKI